MVFNGHINKVDEPLRAAFPNLEGSDTPDILKFPQNWFDAVAQVESALKPLMDVTAKNLSSFKGRVGLTQAVVYISTFLTHQYIVVANGPKNRLVNRSRRRLGRRTNSTARHGQERLSAGRPLEGASPGLVRP